MTELATGRVKVNSTVSKSPRKWKAHHEEPVTTLVRTIDRECAPRNPDCTIPVDPFHDALRALLKRPVTIRHELTHALQAIARAEATVRVSRALVAESRARVERRRV